MAEARLCDKKSGRLNLKKVYTALSSTLKFNKDRDKVEKFTGDTLACESNKKIESSNLWVNAISSSSEKSNFDCGLANPQKSCKSGDSDAKSVKICYELKKEKASAVTKIEAWPRCTTYHPCRGSDPGALLDGPINLNKLSLPKNQVTKLKGNKDEKSKSKEDKSKYDRPSSIVKKTNSKDDSFAHVVPPPPAPIPFSFSHHEDAMSHAIDYRINYTYGKLQTMQKSVKARQAQSRAKIVAMDSRSVNQTIKSKISKQNSFPSFRQYTSSEISKLKSPDSDCSVQLNSRRTSVASQTSKKCLKMSNVYLQFSGKMKENNDCKDSQKIKKLDLKQCEQIQYKNDWHQKKVSCNSLENLDQSSGLVQNRTSSPSCATWPPNSSPSRKRENDHRNLIAARQQRLQKVDKKLQANTMSLPSSPKKIVSLKSRKTLTPPVSRRRYF